MGAKLESAALADDAPHLLVVDHRVTPSATPHEANADLFNATLWFNTATARR